MAGLTPSPKQQIFGTDGLPLVGGKIYTYAAGTTTPIATYTDSTAGTANTNPIILNSLGQANIWLATATSYKFSVFTSTDVLLYTVDNITSPIDSATLTATLASPPPIGSTAPNTGAFTTATITTVNATNVTATSTVTAETLTFEGGGSMTKVPESVIQPITATAATNALTITLNPTTLDFRSATLTSGTVVSRVISSAISVTVSSGSTLGTVSAVQSRIVVLALDNAGTVELAVVNIAGGNDLTETGVISTTAEGGAGAADSNNVIYSTTARTSKAYRVVGYIESTQATAGTWATAPSTIQGCGGQALTAMSSLGYGQTPQVITVVQSTTYYNTTGKPYLVSVTAQSSITNSVMTALITSGSASQNFYGSSNGAGAGGEISITFLVPVGGSFLVSATLSATLSGINATALK